MSARNIHKDTVIDGGGMLGLHLDLALHHKGLKVALVEAKVIKYQSWRSDIVETGVSAIKHSSKSFL
ncbi:2-octaprenyl-3-methyl-6-methoxy-1,4-benzoquinol hydroxylase, partial [Francisella tularensis subsp. holarctica]|nr:2-octaprenyl-3-methyl-6-methoxy-1,4-benzoquinol hydroxylase [Francisella tularensis subsp. holarctica]